MHDDQKTTMLETARRHIARVQDELRQAFESKETKTARLSSSVTTLKGADAIIERTLLAHHQEQLGNLQKLYPSPYFAFCDFETKGERKPMYFGKFSFRDANIYSWITPAAALRFEAPGKASYTRPDGSAQTGIIHRKDHYLIVDGMILFFATESPAQGRELVYQEHFSRHKAGFVLPEVVEQMEKAQDQVIRTAYAGPLVVTGPAGSGKTTLALHRVAYLMQSPETAEFFPPENVLVLVQDEGTKAYFSNLLPSLGIDRVAIQTFSEWAKELLGITTYRAPSHVAGGGFDALPYEYAKLAALRSGSAPEQYRSLEKTLELFYAPFFGVNERERWREQVTTKTLDRFDLTLLLNARKTSGPFTIEKTYYEELRNGAYRKKTGSFPVRYNLVIIDEFQNYLPEQIELVKSCLNPRTNAVVYVGDLAQQTRLGTLRDWRSIGEDIAPERVVRLHKVYRNTKQILNYIQTLGYAVEIPDGIKDGAPVVEHAAASREQERSVLQTLIPNDPGMTLGILSPDAKYLADLKLFFADHANVHCLTFHEAQGVEFDTVAIVGLDEHFFATEHLPSGTREEARKIQRDLLYVALTRAMSALHIVKIKPAGRTGRD